MPKKDMSNRVRSVTFKTGAITADAWVPYIDTLGFESVTIQCMTRMTTASSSNSFQPIIQEADVAPTTPAAAGSYSAVAATDLVGTAPAVVEQTASDVNAQVGYIGSQRYIAVLVDETGTAEGEVIVTYILGHGSEMPDTQTLTTGAVS